MLPPDKPPTSAGICNYFSGGADHYEPDRDQAAAIAPGGLADVFRRMARHNHGYLAAAVRHMAWQGITQFLDLGCGYPLTGGDRDEFRSTHEAARDAQPDARVVYVDTDEEVVEYVNGVLAAKADGIGAVRADMACVRQVLGSEMVRGLIDRREPVGLVFGLSLHYLPAGRDQVTVATYVSGIAAGSMAVITVPRYDDETLFARVRKTCTVADLRNLTAAQTRALFSGLDILEPGIGPVASRRPTVHVVGGTGIKPRL